jgi:hypothetical protein
MTKKTLVLIASLCAACSPQVDEPSGESSNALGGDGFRERDSSPSIDVPTPHHTSVFRLVRQADSKRAPHYVRGSVDVLASFVPWQSRWLVSGGSAYMPSKKSVIGCFTTTNSLAATDAPGSIATVCAAIPETGGHFGQILHAGAWVRGVGQDGTVIYSSDPNPMKTASDPEGKGCLAAKWTGTSWTSLGKSFCSLDYLKGTKCSDPCWKTPGAMDAEGRCVVSTSAVPACAAPLHCTGDPARLCE